MATEKITLGVNIVSNTEAEIVKGVKLKKTYEDVQKAAGNISGTAGSRAVSAKAAPVSSGGNGGLSGQQYGTAQGVTGMGSSARDFAKEAQGLGGLVRVYATFAANLFAVSAAFSGLKNAADTTNLVKGLDTLGATSGKALGTLSKRLVDVTDGAVSMREAMTATAQASSAGMSGKNIERLALVAKNASLALGVSMPDALSRLSRGITKLEPELLDELGLFSKIGPATEKYALEIGKSASALTDFERRQAFANAVLEEGEKKFGALADAAANPYDKLLANLKNVLQSGGELINKVLTPIVSLLASSPSALSAVLAGIGYVLLKQALPAIGQLRAGLRNTAEEALASSKAFKESFGDEFQTILEKRFKIPDLESGVRKAEADLAKLSVPSKLAPSVAKLATGDEASLKNVEAVLRRKNKLIEDAAAGTRKASEAQVAAAQKEITYINAAIKAYETKQALAQARTGTQNVADTPLSRFDPEIIALKKYESLRKKVDQADAIANAAQVAQVAGIRASWGLLNKEIADKGITGFAKYSTLAQGGLAAIGTRVMGIVGSLGYLGQVVALATGAFMLLDGVFSKNSKQTETFSKALTTVEESVTNVFRTLQAATSTEGFATKTIANTVALSNAFNELTTSAKEALKTANAAAEAAGMWDKFWNGIFSIVGQGRDSKLADSIAKQISSSIDILSREGLADEYAREIKKILNVDNLKDIDAVSRAWKNLSKEQQVSILAIQDNSNRALGNASSALQGFADKTTTALTAYKTFTNSFIDTSPLFKLGEAYIDIGQSLAEIAAAGPGRIAQAFEELANNSQKAALFGKDFVKAFAPIAEDFKKQKAALDALNVSLIKQVEVRKTLSTETSAFTPTRTGVFRTPQAENKQKAELADENIRLTNRAISSLNTSAIETGTKLLADAAKKAVDTGLALINKSIANARTTADIGMSKVLSSVLTGPRKLEADNEARQRELKLQLEDVNISETLINIQSSLVDEMRLANALQSEANALQKGDKSAIERTTLEAQKARAVLGQRDNDIPQSVIDQVEKQQKENKERATKGLQSKRIAITGEMSASKLNMDLQMPGATLQQQEQLLKITDRKLAAERASLDINTAIEGVTSSTSIALKQAAEAAALKRAQESEIAAINADIEKTELAKSKAKGNDSTRLAEQLKVLGKIKTETEAAQKAESDTKALFNKQTILKFNLDTSKRDYEVLAAKNTLQNTVLTTEQQISEARQAAYAALGNLTEVEKANTVYTSELNKSNLTAQIAINEKIAQSVELEKTRNIEKAALGAGADTTAFQAETDRQVSLINFTIAGLATEVSARNTILAITKESSVYLGKQADEMTRMRDITANLAEVFGKLGESIGKAGEAILKMSQDDNNYAKQKLAVQQKIKAVEDSGDTVGIDLQNEKIALDKKSAKSEISNMGAVAGATKNMFKEKTFAYKAFAAFEKAMSVIKLATLAAEVAGELGLTAVSVTASGTRAGAKGTESIVNAMKDLPSPFNFMAGAAMAAIVASLLGGSGGSADISIPGGMTSEQRQETQGTAMGYDSSGNKVQVRRGVFGDENAKSESIANSLEIMKANSVAGLDYDNRMLRALEELNEALNSAAKGLFGIKGLRTGSLSGTTEGTSADGGFLGLFSSSTSRSIIDSGLQLKGTFYDLAKGVRGTIKTFETISTTSRSSGFFGIGASTSTSVSTQFNDLAELDPKAFKALANTFNFASDLLYSTAETANVTSEAVTNALKSINIDQMASLRGLTGENFTKELSAVIGSVLDDASLVIFSSFEKYANFGEGMLETVLRVVDTNKKVAQAIKNIGSSFDASKNYNITSQDITEALAKVAGGLDKFLDQANFFTENFLTEAERLVPVQSAVTAEMSKLGFASVNTRKEFKALVQGLDLSTDAGINNFQALMRVQEGFIEVTKAVEDLNSKIYDFDISIYTELGNAEKALQLTREKELEALDDSLKPIQKYLNALKDESTVKAKIATAYKDQSAALKTTITGLKNSIKTLNDYKTALSVGANSLLTPAEKYAQAKSTMLETASLARKVIDSASTPEDIAARDAAVSKLGSTSDAFLSSSKEMFASSDRYTQDFKTVLELLDASSLALGVQQTEAEKQQTALDASVSFLNLISTSTDTTASLLAQLVTLQTATEIARSGAASAGSAAAMTIPAMASGGIAKGLTLVGENGPELANFAAAARIYPNQASNDIFNTKELVAEIRSLKAEVSQLRADQKAQTGHLIAANYDANAKNAEAVAEATDAALVDQTWKQRSQVKIA